MEAQRKDSGKDYIDLITLFTEKHPVKPGDKGKNAWLIFGYPVYWWPLTLFVLVFGAIALAWFVR